MEYTGDSPQGSGDWPRQIDLRDGATRMDTTPRIAEFGTTQDALSLATRCVPVVSPDTSARSARQTLMDHRFDCVTEIAVCEGDQYLGLISVEAMLIANDNTVSRDLIDEHAPVVRADTDQEVAAWAATQAKRRAIAVVDNANQFLGLIPSERLLAVLHAEHAEDMARLGGYLQSASSARSAAEEPVIRRFLHRLPWLLIGLLGAFLVAGIIGSFESQLQGNIMLLFFIPSVVYLADAVGTQTETIIIRGLSVGVSIRRILGRELLTGVLVGLTIALAFFPVTWWWWGDSQLAIIVTIALVAASSIATIVAMLLPWIFHRLGTDPAFGSGPLATVIQDLLSVSIYLAIAILVMELAA
jgi:magnesium transporter